MFATLPLQLLSLSLLAMVARSAPLEAANAVNLAEAARTTSSTRKPTSTTSSRRTTTTTRRSTTSTRRPTSTTRRTTSTKKPTTTTKPTSTRRPTSTVKTSSKRTSTKPSATPTTQPKSCPKYLFIETRGTGLEQGSDPSFAATLDEIDDVVTVKEYDTVYPAANNQHYWVGTTDIINRVKKSNSQCPLTKIILAGMSQGASATTTALQRISLNSVAGKSIAATLLFGNPMHRAKKLSNVDSFGGKSTANVNGVYGPKEEGIPTDWDRSGKVMDLCRLNDCICNGTSTTGNIEHLAYAFDLDAARTASKFVLKRLGK